uniref:Uncharacterized protein n=1 Tax=Rhizophora mucronata TaxID=61149 RepID=A0A2P2PD89_RHIMU
MLNLAQSKEKTKFTNSYTGRLSSDKVRS